MDSSRIQAAQPAGEEVGCEHTLSFFPSQVGGGTVYRPGPVLGVGDTPVNSTDTVHGPPVCSS